MSRYAKTVAAILGAIGTWGMTAYTTGSEITGDEWFGLLVALGTAAAVFGVPNKPPAGEASRSDISEVG
jgi:hypothetical protein